MGRSWSGFLPQNELIKLQWEALEACQVQAAVLAFKLLFSDVIPSQEKPENDDSEELGIFRGLGESKE